MVTLKEIYFTSAREFNDPFDCRIPPRYDLLCEDQQLKIIAKHMNKMHPLSDREEIYKDAKVWRSKEMLNNPDFWREAEKRAEKYKYDNFGMFTLSALPDNILMWSHYADSHRGFCVEFDTIKLDDYRRRLFYSDRILVSAQKVQYRRDVPIIIPGKLSPEKTVIRQLTIKSDSWAYEKEYRFILMNKTNHPLYLLDGIITKIILGLEMRAEHKNEIIDVLKQGDRRIKLQQAVKSKNSFALDFENIEY